MAELTYSETEKKIAIDEFFKVIAWLDKNLAVGVELERPCASAHSTIASRLNTEVANGMQMRGDGSLPRYKKAGCSKYNVLDVRGDGTVHNNEGRAGVEIVFAGTTEKYAYIRQRLEEIEHILDRLGCDDYDSSCSNHISVVSVTDRLLPTAVLKNILQITRGFSSGLYWICGAESRITRRTIGHNAPPLHNFTPLNKSLRNMIAQGKYCMCNMSKQGYFLTSAERGAGEQSDNMMMSGIFVEFRNPDGMRVPSALASLMMMYKAIVYKAVELSTKGVLNVDSIGGWTTNKQVSMAIVEGSPTVVQKTFAKKNAKALLDFVMPQVKMVAPEAVEILSALAEKPVGQRLGSDVTYKTIEKDLSGRKSDEALSDSEQRVVEIVMNGQVHAATPALYREAVAQELKVSVRMIEYLMQKVKEKTGKSIVYDSEMKRYRIE